MDIEKAYRNCCKVAIASVAVTTLLSASSLYAEDATPTTLPTVVEETPAEDVAPASEDAVVATPVTLDFEVVTDDSKVEEATTVTETPEVAVESTVEAETPVVVVEPTVEAETPEVAVEPTVVTGVPEVTQETTTVTETTVVTETTTTEVVEGAIGPDAEMLVGYAKEIIEAIEDKLEWKDIPVVMEMSAKMLGHFSKLTVEMKRDCLIDVLNYVIDNTDTPWLPDRLTDPFFKAMIPPFAYIFITDDFLAEIDFTVPQELVESKDFVGVAEMIRAKFSDGFRWSDLTFAIGAAFTFGEQLTDLSWEERGDVMIDLVDYIVDNTDTPWMPDSFSDPIFKAFAHTTIQVMVMSKKNEELGAGEAALLEEVAALAKNN